MQRSLFSSFNQESSGGAGGAISSMLRGSLAIGGASGSASSGDYLSLASVLGGSALTDAEPGDMLPTPKKSSFGGGTTRKWGSLTASPNLADSSPRRPPVKIEQVDRPPATKRPRAQSQQPAKKEVADSDAAGKRGRGRPADDNMIDVNKEVKMFSESAESDVLWWGKEGATKRKYLCLLRSRVQHDRGGRAEAG